MSDDQFYEDCLGCGLAWDGTNLSASVDGTSLQAGVNGLQAADQVEAAAIGVINGSSTAFPYNPGCNGLKYDCETGALWYPTPPCRVGDAARASFPALSGDDERVSVQTAQHTVMQASAKESDLCYEGMQTVLFGWFETRLYITSNDSNQPLEGFELDYNISLYDEGNSVFKERVREATVGVNMEVFQRTITQKIPVVACSGPYSDLQMILNFRLESGYRNIGTSPTMNFEFDYSFSGSAFTAKECS